MRRTKNGLTKWIQTILSSLCVSTLLYSLTIIPSFINLLSGFSSKSTDILGVVVGIMWSIDNLNEQIGFID